LSFIPWRRVKSWECSACGECCKWFKVPLMMDEYAFMMNTFGCSCLDLDVGRAYLARRLDGRCIFQFPSNGRWICGLQRTKPLVCKLWPFILMGRPKYGRSELASFTDGYSKYYVYVDPKCRGLRWGEPSRTIAERILPEIIRISLEKGRDQVYSTSRTLPLHTARGQFELTTTSPWPTIPDYNSSHREDGGGLIPNVASSVIVFPSRITPRTTRSPGLL